MFPVDVVKLIDIVNQIQGEVLQKQDLLNKLDFENNQLSNKLEYINQSMLLLQQQLKDNSEYLEQLETSGF